MKEPVITLYVNDPMGRRCTSNMDFAGRAAKNLGAEIKTIKKTSKEYLNEKDPPPCQSVTVNGRFIARNDMVSFEALKAAFLNDRSI